MTQGEINAVNRLSRAFEAFNSDPGIKKLNKTLSGLGPKLDKLIALLERIVPEGDEETHVSMAQMREEHPEVVEQAKVRLHDPAAYATAQAHIKHERGMPAYLRRYHAVTPPEAKENPDGKEEA